MAAGYTEAQLVENRAAVLVWGGAETDRLAWAEEAASHFPTGGLKVVSAGSGVPAALASPEGVVFVPEVALLDNAAQLEVVRCLREREERPKIIVALSGSRQKAFDSGVLRPDLDWVLSLGRVDLDAQAVRDSVRARRAKGASKKRRR